jgi:hypothetical protein
MRRFTAVALAALVAVAPVRGQAPRALTDSAFAALVGRLSEQGGFFDTDNLISNEDSYLHPVGTLRRLGVSGGAYIGVGPDQNFSYIAAVRPHIAFILDIRRDNLLEHLLFKSLFSLSRNRIEYLCLLFGKSPPPDTAGWGSRSVDDLLRYIDGARADSSTAAKTRARVLERAGKSGIALSAADLHTIGLFHLAFVLQGPSLRFTSFGRAPQPYYPDLRRLLRETDRAGRQASYVANEADFQYVKSLEDRNLVVPVVGDFAGGKALPALAEWLRAQRETVSVFYTSNVEQYLFRDGGFARFANGVVQLPRDARSVLIRSYFGSAGVHPQAVTGYHAVQLVQRMDRFAAVQAGGGFRGYFDLVERDLVDP